MKIDDKVLALFILVIVYVADLNAQDSLNVHEERNIRYEFSYALSLGGESKLSLLLPKLNFTCKHMYSKANLYYGLGVGVHAHFLGGWGTLNGLVGIEIKRLDLESSYSYVWMTKIEYPENSPMGPCRQNLLNLKLGYKFKHSKLRIVTSYVLREMVPVGHERNPLLDVGKINDNFILGLEYTALINHR